MKPTTEPGSLVVVEGRVLDHSTPVSFSRQRRLLVTTSFLTSFAESMLVPLYAAFTARVGGSILDAGIAFACFSIATGAFVSLIGTRSWFQDHLRAFLVLGFLGSACCDISYIFVQNRWQLFAAQVIAGLATGLLEPAWDSLFTDAVERTSAKHWSIWSGGTHLVAGVAALLGGVIVAYFSFKALFVTMGLADTLATFLAWRGNLPKGTRNPLKNAPAAVTGD
ncbi:MAG TPA: MFS transporter [Polyangia bacterium]|nr:MFS transporter [Polyangia bacterium]